MIGPYTSRVCLDDDFLQSEKWAWAHEISIGENDIVLFLSPRFQKILAPLNSIGLFPKTIVLSGGIFKKFLKTFSLFGALFVRPKACVLVDSADVNGLLAWIVCFLLRRKIILRSRGDTIRECTTEGRKFLLWFDRKFIPSTIGIITVSDYLKTRLLSVFPDMDPEKITTVNLPLPQNKTYFKRDNNGARRKSLLVVMKFNFKEKIALLLDRLPELDAFLDAHGDYCVDVLGDGPYQGIVTQSITTCRNADRINLLGFVSDPSPYYSTSFALLHLSHMDGYPSVIDEARLNGLPVIASNNICFMEMINHGHDGFLVDEDLDNLSSIMSRLEQREAYDAIQHNGLKRIMEVNSYEHIGMRMCRAIKRYIEKSGTGKYGNEKRTDKPSAEKKDRKVAFFIKQLDRPGGSEKQLMCLINALKEADQYLLYTLQGQKLHIPNQRIIFSESKKYSLFRSMRMAREISLELKGQEVDIVYAFGFEASFTGGMVAKLSGLPFISGRREMATWRTFKHYPLFAFINIISSKITANSQSVLEMTRKEPFASRKVVRVTNAISKTEECGPEPHDIKLIDGDPVICTVANYRPVKNLGLLVEVAKELACKYPSAAFWLAGDGPMRKDLEDAISKYGVEKIFHLLGYRKDVGSLLNCADIFVLSSHSEGFSNSAMEAMMQGLPVVLSRRGGNVELINEGEHGFLFDPNSPDDLAEKIVFLLKHPNLRRVMGMAGKKRVTDLFSDRQMVQSHSILFK